MVELVDEIHGVRKEKERLTAASISGFLSLPFTMNRYRNGSGFVVSYSMCHCHDGRDPRSHDSSSFMERGLVTSGTIHLLSGAREIEDDNESLDQWIKRR